MGSWGLGRAGIFMTEGVFGPWNGPEFTRKTTGEMMLVLCCSAHPLLPRVMESRPPLGIFLGVSVLPCLHPFSWGGVWNAAVVPTVLLQRE